MVIFTFSASWTSSGWRQTKEEALAPKPAFCLTQQKPCYGGWSVCNSWGVGVSTNNFQCFSPPHHLQCDKWNVDDIWEYKGQQVALWGYYCTLYEVIPPSYCYSTTSDETRCLKKQQKKGNTREKLDIARIANAPDFCSISIVRNVKKSSIVHSVYYTLYIGSSSLSAFPAPICRRVAINTFS